MNFYLYSPVEFEKWNFKNSVEKGIGGSETSHVEMAWRLAKRGHKVVNYVPLPKNSPTKWRGTEWYPLKKATFKEKGIWILYRTPSTVDKFPPKSKRVDQKVWLLMQDWDYPDWSNKRVKQCDSVLAMCHWHARSMAQKYPAAKNKIWLNSNGIKLDLIAETEKLNIKRNPKLIIYTSSPDRGLKPLLKSFKKAREYDPELRLIVTYGFNNIDVLIKKNPKSYYVGLKKELLKLMKQPGVKMIGRVTQPELYKLWFQAGMWVYQTNFAETSCISCMEAQAMGAIPIFSPVFAQGENVKWGVPIEGDCDDPLTNARFAGEMVRMANPQLQESIRNPMMKWARETYDWERMVDLWESKALGKKYSYEYPNKHVIW